MLNAKEKKSLKSTQRSGDEIFLWRLWGGGVGRSTPLRVYVKIEDRTFET